MRIVLPRSPGRMAAALASAVVAGAALAACDTSSPITFASSDGHAAGIAGLAVNAAGPSPTPPSSPPSQPATPTKSPAHI
jgi:hypothetical protein